MLSLKLGCVAVLVVGFAIWSASDYNRQTDSAGDVALRQLENPSLQRQVRDAQLARSNQHLIRWGGLALLVGLIFSSEIVRGARLIPQRFRLLVLALLFCVPATGCWRPFEPIKLEVINPNEEGFLLPFTTDPSKQSQTNTEEYFKKNLVFTQQVRIPMQWVSKGYETFGPNGEWQPGAILVKVDKSPVTREWTADPNSGTSSKNEAIWVMTADQVEFSTGWTCTARIASRDDAIKFLHNYPNGTLEKVMDHEIRAFLQAAFGLEVTDLPMDELRKKATPHIKNVTERTEKFFSDRGVQITNIGITGGFVYKDASIIDTLVKVFNAEQEKNIAIAKSSAQIEQNKQVLSEAEGKAAAILKTKKAEADGIKMVADAKAYEMEKAKGDGKTYLALKNLELQKAKIERWDGKFPTYFMGQNDPNLLLQVPVVTDAK
jgi:hypothetical protein